MKFRYIGKGVQFFIIDNLPITMLPILPSIHLKNVMLWFDALIAATVGSNQITLISEILHVEIDLLVASIVMSLYEAHLWQNCCQLDETACQSLSAVFYNRNKVVQHKALIGVTNPERRGQRNGRGRGTFPRSKTGGILPSPSVIFKKEMF